MARNIKHCSFQPNSTPISINQDVPSGYTTPNFKKTNSGFYKLLSNFGMYLMQFEAKKSKKVKIKPTSRKNSHFTLEMISKRKPFRDDDIRRLIRLYAMHDNLYNPQNLYYGDEELIEECFQHMSRYFPGHTAAELQEQIRTLSLLFENDYKAIELSKREGVPTLRPTTKFYDEFIFLQPYVQQEMEAQASMDIEFNAIHKAYGMSRDSMHVTTLPPKREQSGNADIDFKPSSCVCVTEVSDVKEQQDETETKRTESAKAPCQLIAYSDHDCPRADQKKEVVNKSNNNIENTLSRNGTACENVPNSHKSLFMDKLEPEIITECVAGANSTAKCVYVYDTQNSNKDISACGCPMQNTTEPAARLTDVLKVSCSKAGANSTAKCVYVYDTQNSNKDISACGCPMQNTTEPASRLTDVSKVSCSKVKKTMPKNTPRNEKNNNGASAMKTEQTAVGSASCPCTVYETQDTNQNNKDKNRENTKKPCSITKQQQKTCDCCTSISRINCTSSMIHSLQPSCPFSAQDTTQYETTTASSASSFTEYDDNDDVHCKRRNCLQQQQQKQNGKPPNTKSVALDCYSLQECDKREAQSKSVCKVAREELPQVVQVQVLCDMIKTELSSAQDFIYFDAKWRIIEILRDVHKRQLLYQKSAPHKCACELNPKMFKVLTPVAPQPKGKPRNKPCPYCCKSKIN